MLLSGEQHTPATHRIQEAQNQIRAWMFADERRDPTSIFNTFDTRLGPAGFTAAEVEAALIGLAADGMIAAGGYAGHGERHPYQLTALGRRLGALTRR